MEIERNPVPPKFTKKAIELITKLCFRKDNEIKKVDGIFVFSSLTSLNRLAKLIEKILTENVSEKVFITGGKTPLIKNEDINFNEFPTEADAILHKLNLKRFENIKVFVERKSTNTLENVTKMLKYTEFKNCKSLLFIFKSHAAGRGYLTLKRFFPSAEILQRTFDTKYNDAPCEINRDNWHTFDFGASRVWGEFLRIKTYGSRGDIEYKSVKRKVEEIERELKLK